MRIIRYLALFLSISLLVATTVSVVNRRSELVADQTERIEQAATLTDASARSVVLRLRSDVDLLATLIVGGPPGDQRALAEQLARPVPGAEACVGSTSAGCTGSDLFALDGVAELARVSDVAGDSADPTDDRPIAVAAVDTTSAAVIVVRRVGSDNEQTTVAVRLPITDLVSASGLEAAGQVDADVVLVGSGTDSIDDVGTPFIEGGERTLRTTVASPFVAGSLEVSASVDSSIGLAGDSSVRFAVLLALGAILMALAEWGFLVEQRQLERRATTDELTDLVNRREFERISAEAIETARQRDEGLCVMVVDLNGFKQINDTLGHQFGDLVLVAASERFVEAVRDSDVVGRWGGDEFVILLPALDERGAVRRRAERIHDHLTGRPVVGDTSVSGSIGAAMYPRHGTTLEALMQAADVAMYDAKTNGVSYRIADTIETNESMFADDPQATMPQHHAALAVEAPPLIETDGYIGPERRESGVDDLTESPSDDVDTGGGS